MIPYRRRNGKKVRPGVYQRARVGGRDAADGDTGDFEQRRPPAEDRRVRPMHAILGRGWIEGAERDIIGPRLPCLHREVAAVMRSEEHTSELQSLMRISYAVFCLKK